MRKPVVTAFESRNTARLGYLPLRISPQKLYHNDLQTTEQPYPTTDTARGSRLSSPSAADYFDSILPRRSRSASSRAYARIVTSSLPAGFLVFRPPLAFSPWPSP